MPRVLGVLRGALHDPAASGPVMAIAYPAPKTYRADYPIDDPLEYMESQRLESVLVTTPEGRLLGMARLARLRRYVDEVASRVLALGQARDGH